MVNEELKNFVKSSLDKGMSREKISADLLANGWNQNDVDEAFNLLFGSIGASLVDIPKYSPKELSGVNKFLTFAVIFLLVGGGGFTAYKLGYLNSILPGPKIIVSENPLTTAESSEITEEEKEQMFQAAKIYVADNSVSGLEFNLEFVKRTGNYALLRATPTVSGVGTVQVIMEKINDKWVAQTMGTAFEDWYEKAPELFEY